MCVCVCVCVCVRAIDILIIYFKSLNDISYLLYNPMHVSVLHVLTPKKDKQCISVGSEYNQYILYFGTNEHIDLYMRSFDVHCQYT